MSRQRRQPDSHRHSFDDQAPAFDRRAGLPPAIARQVAQTIVGLTKEPTAASTLVELGAGTGQIGRDLAADAEIRYVGIDLSHPMLTEFQSNAPQSAALVQADADASWPIADRAANAIFMARSLHLFSTDRVASETLRINAGAARVLVGGVKRVGESLREQMRDKMRALLGAAGKRGRGRGAASNKLFDALAERGATRQPTVTAAEWAVDERPQDSLDSWAEKDGLAGVDVAIPTKDLILRELRDWAEERFGGLDATHRSIEKYEIQILQLP